MQDLQHRSLRHQRLLLTTAALSMLLLVASALLVLRISRENARADRAVVHTLEVKQAIAHLLALLTSAETGQRGYLITNDPDFLGGYDEAREAAPRDVERLRLLTADNTEQLA